MTNDKRVSLALQRAEQIAPMIIGQKRVAIEVLDCVVLAEELRRLQEIIDKPSE